MQIAFLCVDTEPTPQPALYLVWNARAIAIAVNLHQVASRIVRLAPLIPSLTSLLLLEKTGAEPSALQDLIPQLVSPHALSAPKTSSKTPLVRHLVPSALQIWLPHLSDLQEWKSAYRWNVRAALVSTAVCASRKDTESSAIAQPVSLADVVRLIWMNVLASLATMVDLAQTFLKDTGAHVPQDILESIAKKRNLTAETIHAPKELCAKMNQDTITTHAYADLVTLVQIVI